MKKIALILPEDGLPVPAVQGGAIETLVELLADVNENEKKLSLTIYCRWNSEAEKLSKNYKQSRYVYIKDKNKLPDRLLRRLNNVCKKIFKTKDVYIGNYYAQILKDCRKNNFDYIIAEGGHYPAFRKFTERFGREKLILHIHHYCKDSSLMTGIFGTTISVSHYINDVWVASKKNYEKEKSQRNYVLVNAVDEERFAKDMSDKEKKELRKKLGFRDNDIIVEYLGRILEIKGVEELVDAVISLNDPNIKLLVIGSAGFADNPKQDYCDKITKKINKTGCGVHLGFVDNKKVYKYAKIADIRCLPSKCEEAVSIALIEAMHCGTPLIITKSGGMPEVVPDDGAIIVNKDACLIQKLSDAILKLSSDATLRQKMTKANLEQSKKFRKAEFYKQFVEIIEEGK